MLTVPIKSSDERLFKALTGLSKAEFQKLLVIFIDKMTLFVGYTVGDSIHDYRLLKEEFPPEQNWFATFKLWVDLGYLGINKGV